MSIETFIHKGIKYVSDEFGKFYESINGSRYYYLKYCPHTDSITTSDNILLYTDIEYYVTQCDKEKAYLSLCSSPILEEDQDQIGYISIENLKLGFTMPAATVRFYSAEGTLKNNIELDEDGFYIDQNNFEIQDKKIKLIDATEFVDPEYGRQQIAWRINDLYGTPINDWTEINLNDYAVIYPETEIKLIAEWDFKGTTFDILYYANGSLWKTQTETYSKKWTSLTMETPSKSDYIFSGWRTDAEASYGASEKNDDIHPHYNEGSIIRCKRTSNLILYPIWKKMTTYSITIKSNGGYGGQGSWTTLTTFEFPPATTVPISVESSGNPFSRLTGLPKRYGYTFKGWRHSIDGSMHHNGSDVTALSKGFEGEYVAQWEPATEIIFTESNQKRTLTPTTDFVGQIHCYKIIPTANTVYTIDSTVTNNLAYQHQIIQMYDESGKILTFDNGKKYVHDGLSTISLKKGQTYYLEIMSNSEITKGYYTEFSVTNQEMIDTIVTVNPNGGTYKTYTTATNNEVYTVTVGANKSLAAISSLSVEPLEISENLDVLSQKYYGKPYKDGYSFYEWISYHPNDCKTELYDISANTTLNLYTTNYFPRYDFNVKASWKRNKCYVIYDGNDSTSGYLPFSQHEYGIEKSLSNNHYVRTTTVEYDARGGIYSSSNWENDNLQSYVEFLNPTDSQLRKLKIHHSFDGWWEKPFATSVNQMEQDYKYLTNTILLDNSRYGYTKTVYAGWNFNKIPLPEISKPGFIFLGWFTEREGGVQITNETEITDHDITLYAHWNPIGLVRIYTKEDGWKYAVPYICTNGEWKRALVNVCTDTKWCIGTDLGQNATDQQLEIL